MIGSGEAVRGREKKGAFPIFVPDCDAAYQRAMEAGATSMGEPADRHYGERSGFVKDFAGSHWFIATRFASTPVREGLGSRMPFVYPERARVYIDFLQTAFGAEELFFFESGGRVVHAGVRIGDAVLEMGESPSSSLPSRFFLYAEDCDAWYAPGGRGRSNLNSAARGSAIPSSNRSSVRPAGSRVDPGPLIA